MTNQDLDRIVRDVLEDLAGESRPAPLLDGSFRRARHIRRRRAAATIAAAAVLAVLAVPALTHRTSAPEPARPSPTAVRVSPTSSATPLPVLPVTGTPARVDLPDGFTVTAIGVNGDGPLWIYNRDSGTYVATPYAYASVARSGTHAVVQTRSGNLDLYLIDLHDLTARPLSKLDSVSGQMWSRDGRTVLDGSATPGWLHLIDVGTGERRDVLFRAPQAGCDDTGGCGPAWFRGEDAVTVAVFDPATGKQTGVQVISATTGATIQTLPVKGYVAGACSWSTDGRYVVTEMRPETGDTWLEIVEASTGKRTVRLPAMANANPDALCWTSPTRLLVVDGATVRAFAPDGTPGQQVTVPDADWVTIGPR
ncbi:hypothetical protein ACFPIJ_32110 [Dactylosporangium cerinum]|uniref:WD40 repeat protein n=1 Tax=Dactylosporangium cerinum TaxID=1434730 RepID=A0ABV9W2D4_9ACTN